MEYTFYDDGKIWLYDIAKFYGIDWEAKSISCRGNAYFAELDEDKENGNHVLTICTVTVWSQSELFEEINDEIFFGSCKLAYREIEP